MTSRAAKIGCGLGVLLTALGAGCATPVAPSGSAQPALPLAPCRGPQAVEGALCGVYPVFEDRAARAGRTIPLKVVVVRALGVTPARDPVFFLVGGPGLGAASTTPRGIGEYWERMRRHRDLVFVDQRGTGESGPLRCRLSGDAAAQSGFEDLLPVDGIRACRQTLETTADLRLYTTRIAMDDLDEVRAALGYETINIWGISYGGMAALRYLRQHPGRVRSLVLAAPLTPEHKQPLHFARGAQAALDLLIADCAAEEACRRAFPDLRRDLDAALGRFAAGPVTFDLPGAAGRARMSRGVFVERLRLMLYRLESASRIPLVLHRAAQGDWLPFARATWPTLGAGASSAFSLGTYLTITCSESVPGITEPDIVRETRDTFVGEYRTRVHVRACQEWPQGSIPAEYDAPIASPVPVLILSGELDPTDSAAGVGAATRALSNRRQIRIRNAAHDYSTAACLRDLAADFIASGSARDLDTRCVEQLRRPAFVTE